MCKRILVGWYLFGQNQGYFVINIRVNVQGNYKENVCVVVRDGIVLLKNDGILLFFKLRKIVVVGFYFVNNFQGINVCVDKGCNVGIFGMGWGLGSVNYFYFVFLYDVFWICVQVDGI